MSLTLAKPDTAADDQLAYLPLSSLILSPLNARQDVDPAEIAAMADSISMLGLLQNLIGLQQGSSGPVEIVAGGKRLRALQLLQAQGFMPRADSRLDFARIPVRVTTDPTVALEWAGAENTARTQPHPADEVRAYRTMAQRDFTARTIALAFAQTEAHVKRRLALASLPDPVLDALRADQITLDQAAAFTVARSEEQALETLSALQAAGATAWGWAARDIRNKLTADLPGARDKRLRFIGLDAYTAAGGTMTLDLFNDFSYVNDAVLLTRLAKDKLQAEGAALQQAEGWSFLWVLADDRELWGKADVLPRTEGTLPDADQDEYDRLSDLANGGGVDDDEQAQLDALQDRLDGDWTDADRARAGIAVWITFDGDLGTRRAIVMRDTTPPPPDEGDDSPTSAAPAPEAGLPQNLRDDLRAIRLLALQEALLGQPVILIELLKWQISGGDMIAWQMPLNIKADRSPNMPANQDGLIVPKRLADPEPASTRMRPNPAAFLSWLSLAEADRDLATQAAIARAFHQPTGLLSVHLAQKLRPDARKLWTPTASNFFNRVPTTMLAAIWADLVPADREAEHQAFAATPKKSRAAELHKLFNSDDYREALGLSRDQQTRIAQWLPEDLRWPKPDSEDQDNAA